MKTEMLKVMGIADRAYAEKMRSALLEMNGVAAVSFAIDDGQAIVQFDEEVTSIETLQAQLKNAGYETAADTSEVKKSSGCCGGCGG